MEHAKKLILVEPRVLEQLQAHREYKELEKPAHKKTKTSTSMQMKRMLDDEMPDDIKAKLYRQAFSHFLNLKNRLPFQQQVKVNRLTPRTPAPAPPSPTLPSPVASTSSAQSPTPQPPPPKPKRQRKTPQRLKSPMVRWSEYKTK